MPNKPLISTLLCVSMFGAGSAGAEVFVYPSQGQSAEQQSKDEYDCYQWARQKTGVDPAQVPDQVVISEPAKGGAGRGLVGGGLLGLGVGALAGNAGKGAAIGAASGALVGGIRRHDQVTKQQQTAEQIAASNDAKLATYDRAYSACLEGRGYTLR